MRVIALRIGLLALACSIAGSLLDAAPLVWLAVALALIAIAARLAAATAGSAS